MSNEERILEILTSMQADVKNIKSDITDMKSDITDMKSDITDMKSDIQNLKAGQAELNKRIDTVNGDINKVLNFALDAEEANEKRHKELFKKLDTIQRVTEHNTFNIADLQTRAI